MSVEHPTREERERIEFTPLSKEDPTEYRMIAKGRFFDFVRGQRCEYTGANKDELQYVNFFEVENEEMVKIPYKQQHREFVAKCVVSTHLLCRDLLHHVLSERC